ncbi:MAG TPA: AMP-binding protein, partial [Dehalococcoidia bacterium]|nr:AMP-binding protein [Dehalococcoidia bacterium]
SGVVWKTLDSRALLRQVDALADELTVAGVREGDRVVLWAPNAPRTVVCLFAIWKLGAIVVPFDREMNAAAGRAILRAVDPRLVLNGYGEQPAWAGEGGTAEWWEPGSRGGAAPADGGARSAASGEWKRPAEELAAIVFTSGTTGNPKGCMITHANLGSQVEALHETIPLGPGCRLGSILPLSHLFELTVGLLYPLSCGAAIHYIPSRRGPDVVRVLKEQRVTHMIAVPQLLQTMGEALEQQLDQRLPAPARRALFATATRLPLAARRRLFFFVHRRIGGQLRMMAAGGAALPVETQALWERFGVRIVQGYGTSECSPVVACGAGDGSTPPGSVGQPLRNVQVRLGEDGELLVKGPNVMLGYWRDPERTAEVLGDGWYATGDLASIDERGNIWLAGRAKDLIVLPSGMNVWPQDVEDALRATGAVKDAAVVAVPRAAGGASLHAYLLPAGTRDREQEPAAIVARANAALAPHQRVATASWWPDADFPRTSTLKVKRNQLPLPEALPATDAPAVSAALAQDATARAIAGIARVPSVRDEQTLGALGLDSLSIVELALSLEEKTGNHVPDDALSLEMSVAQVRAFLQGAASAGGGDGRPAERVAARQPLWPYTWGRVFRSLSLPFDLLYRASVTQTIVLGGEHLRRLPRGVVFAGTHHSFSDLPLLRAGLRRTPARRLAGRLVVATGAGAFQAAGPLASFGALAFGLYPLRQRGEQDESLRGLAKLAGKGNAVLIFPQGTHVDPARERAGDPQASFRNGAAHLALALEAPVVPFGVAGTERILPPHADEFSGLKIAGIPVSIRRGPLAIAFGAPLRPEPGELPAAFTARLQAASFALARQAEAALGDASR